MFQQQERFDLLLLLLLLFYKISQTKINQLKKLNQKKGTTITISNIFEPLPVRHKEFKKNIKKEFLKSLNLIQSYALMSLGVRIICTNQVAGS